MKGTDKLNTQTNIVYVITDVLETNLHDMQAEFKKNGYELKHEAKRNFNVAIAAIRRLRSDLNACSDSTQENFGNDADIVNTMLLTIIDRCGDDDHFTFKLYNYIKAFPSRLGLDIDDSRTFEHLLKE